MYGIATTFSHKLQLLNLLYCISGSTSQECFTSLIYLLLGLKDYGKQSYKAHSLSRQCKFPGKSMGLLEQGLQDLTLNLMNCFNLSSCCFSFAVRSLLCISTKEYIFLLTNTHTQNFIIGQVEKINFACNIIHALSVSCAYELETSPSYFCSPTNPKLR